MYKIDNIQPEKLIEVAVELRSRATIECDNTGYNYPLHTKLIHFKLLKNKYSVENIWQELNKLGFYSSIWFIQTFWISDEVEVLGEFISSHEQLDYSIYKKDNLYYLLNERELSIVGESLYVDDLPFLISPDESINNFIG